MMLNYTVEARIASPGFLAEIQQVDWDFEDEVELEWDDYRIGFPLSRLRLHEQTNWHFPETRTSTRAALFGLAPPHFPIRFKRAKGGVRRLSCAVEPDHFERVTGFSRWTVDELLILLRSNSPFFRVILDRMTSEILHPGFASVALMSSLSDCLLLEIAHLLQKSAVVRVEGQILDWQLRKLREVIHDSPHLRDLSVASLAAMCGISGRHLMRGFKAATGVTIHGYIEQVRLERAKRLLERDDMQLKRIASEMGFSSASHMSLAFRKLTGIAPSEYRSISRARHYKAGRESAELPSGEVGSRGQPACAHH